MSQNLPKGPMISIEAAAELFGQKNIKFLESKMKPIGAADIWETGQKITGAVQMDINTDFSELNTSLPHMLPNAAYFENAAKNIGLNNEDIIIVYDQVGVYGSPRAYWMLKVMGHQAVYVLNGGMPAWLAAHLPSEKAEWPDISNGNFQATFNKTLVKSAEEVRELLKDEGYRLLDARPAGRFTGEVPEPRAGLRGGHMPGSGNLPATNVTDGWYLKTEEELKALIAPLLSNDKQLVTSCGSGVTACIIGLAAEVAGYGDFAVYDGSWTEWGGLSSDFEVVKS